ncbi:acyl-CoA synthetase [Streptomyces abyssomicinicus]|uniref:acyl-CoA synthetase n=1 Tax=Streptomyces abyssomicinicus TaxID=574929 RepID=UPI00124FFB49|nr:long-chain fatty acid--CoA ligase [Streptomyces abyssomicinicus]
MAQVDISPATALYRRARYAPAGIALVDEEQEITAAALADSVRRLARGLAEGGVRRGDRVAYLGLNSADFFRTMLAAHHLGAVYVPLNFRLAADEIRHILTDCGAHTLVAEEGHREIAESVLGETPVRLRVLAGAGPAEGGAASWRALAGLAAGEGSDRDPQPCGEDDLAVLMYTSGTTGRPKGVMLTHGNVWWNAVNVDGMVDTRPHDVNLAVAPLFHIGGLNALTLRALLRGGTVVVRRRFDAGRTLRDIARYRVDSLFAVPAMFADLSQHPDFAAADLGSLRACIVAGAAVPPQLIRTWANAHGVMLQQAWGMTETAPFATYLPAEHTLGRTGSAGIPMPFTDVCLKNPATGESVDKPMERGEICVRGANVTRGYWDNPAATAASFDSAGWFHSGDIGYLDEDGYLYVVDRLKEMIISGGENVYPAELERVLAEFPGVTEAAVVGVPDARWGETVVAVITCVTGTPAPTVEEVREFAGRYLARYKLPTRVIVVDELPRNASGKLAKAPLRSLAADD